MPCENKNWVSPACRNEETLPSALRDEFFWLYAINKASVVVNSSIGLLEPKLARRIAACLQAVYAKGCVKGAPRPFRVIDFEPKLIEEAGVEATMLHVGRSSQDMHATYRSTIMRDNLNSLMQALLAVMNTLEAMARANVDTIVPNYTNGVAAQPNSYAHYLLGFLSAFNRDAERLRELYARINECAIHLNKKKHPYSIHEFTKLCKDRLDTKSLSFVMLSIIRQLKEQGRVRTSETYRCTFDSFMRFRDGEETCLDEINQETIKAYETYLKNKQLTLNTISFYMRILRAAYNHAVENGLTVQRHPFRHRNPHGKPLPCGFAYRQRRLGAPQRHSEKRRLQRLL